MASCRHDFPGIYTGERYPADNLASKMERSKELARAGDSVAALDLASKLVADYPGDTEAWLLRAYLHELSESFKEA